MVKIVSVVSWLVSLWICKVFLFSIPYKFSGHPDTAHIFTTIGLWMQDVISIGLGSVFIEYGAIIVGSAELLVCLILLLPALLFVLSKLSSTQLASNRAYWHCVGGGMASIVMFGAVFFHLSTPLGVEVLHNGQSDGGSLFYTAASIFILGALISITNYLLLTNNQREDISF